VKKERQMSDDVLVKYLLGEVSETEQSDVEQWIGENPANKNEFNNFRLIWEQSRSLLPLPAISTDEAWKKFQLGLHKQQPVPKKIVSLGRYNGLKAAAVLLLLAGTGLFTVLHNRTASNRMATADHPERPAVQAGQVQGAAGISQVKQEITGQKEVTPNNIPGTPPKKDKAPQASKESLAIKKKVKSTKTFAFKPTYTRTKINGFICNSTPYAFEICIIQSVKCKNTATKATSTCNVLEPDQSGKLRYEAIGKTRKNCRATIDEITITKISTGETIVLNSHSKPTTAQNFFNHITGKKKGDVFAGMFHCDGQDDKDDCGLTFDSNFGNLSLQ